jgi:hypothetical protein
MLMAVMMPREKWTDERLDDLNKKVDDVRAEMRAGFARVDADLRELSARIDAMNRNLVAGLFVVVAAIIGSNAAVLSLLA